MSQCRLSELTGISLPQLHRLETGVCIPRADKLPILAKALGCRIDDLFTQEELEGKASAQTLLPEAHSESDPGGDTPPWEDDDDLTGILE